MQGYRFYLPVFSGIMTEPSILSVHGKILSLSLLCPYAGIFYAASSSDEKGLFYSILALSNV